MIKTISLIKVYISLVLVASIFFSTAHASIDTAEATQYLQKIQEFGEVTQKQLKDFEEFVKEVPLIDAEAATQTAIVLKSHRRILWRQIEGIKSLYAKNFVLKTASKEERKQLVSLESNLSIATHRQLTLLRDFLALREEKTKIVSKKLMSTMARFDGITSELDAGKSVAVPPSMGISQVFQSGKRIVGSMCKLVFGLCLRKSLSQLMDSLDESNFLRSQSYTFYGVDEVKSKLELDPKSVFILIGNHDQPLMDIALARKVSLLLGSEHHITMTRKSVYPIPPPEKAGDVVFVVDNDPNSNPVQKSLDLLSKNILEKSFNRVSLAVYPEGMLPYTGGQMPMTVKEGAFVIARKLAKSLSDKGIPVYLVQMKTNIIEHLTALDEIPAKVVLEKIEKVPDTAIDRAVPDEWIESRRLQAENSFNSHRGRSQIDIFNSEKVPSSIIPYGLSMKSCSRVLIQE